MDEAFRILDDGRVFFDYGPASMVVTARRGDENLSDLAASAFPFLRDSLSEIAGQRTMRSRDCQKLFLLQIKKQKKQFLLQQRNFRMTGERNIPEPMKALP